MLNFNFRFFWEIQNSKLKCIFVFHFFRKTFGTRVHVLETLCGRWSGQYKMQTADQEHNADWQEILLFCVRNEITFDSRSYLLSRKNLTMSSPINNTITLSFSEMLFYRMVRYWFISSCGKIKRYNACELLPSLVAKTVTLFAPRWLDASFIIVQSAWSKSVTADEMPQTQVVRTLS